MELWGGVECTVSRVGDRWCDQSRLSGHHDRLEDLAGFAELGIRRLRMPLLWERVAPDAPDERDWSWSDLFFGEARHLGLKPIAGLIHHGSGPHYTSLIDPGFPELFAEHAAAAAERYPWIGDWTPVNEPLTTARFSALYGHWYPHARDEHSFWTALLNQVDATRLAMRAIRRVNPAARLVQTEDLGETYSTPPLAGVSAYYNDRRWLSWDLLAGRVVPGHPLWSQAVELGFEPRLHAIAADPCPPDLLGINHYVTSDRFLDHRTALHGGAVPETGYHDVTAARVMDPPPPGLANALEAAWQRYGIPLAVTEAHIGCTRDEQMRWLWQGWHACERLAQAGVPIEGFTAWALLGSYDWNSLLTVPAGHYEPGPFDVSGGSPRATAVARLLRALGGNEADMAWARANPVLAGQGWWERDIRIEHPPFAWNGARRAAPLPHGCSGILITGATGRLGRALAGACELRGLPYRLTDRRMLDLDDAASIAAALDDYRPCAVINAAGWARVDEAERDPDACRRANALGAARLAEACAGRDIHLTIVSSDLVFDGAAGRAYRESDLPNPLSAYGRSKAEAERLVLEADPGALVVRSAGFFSPWDERNFAVQVEDALSAGAHFRAAAEGFVTPTYVPDLARALLDLVIDGASGVWHLTSGEATGWVDFARAIAGALGLDPSLVGPADPAALGWIAPRPAAAALVSERGLLLPPLSDALRRHAAVRAGMRADRAQAA